MPRRRDPEREPPTLNPHKALLLLKEKIESGTKLLSAHHEDPRITEWENSVENLLALAFGNPNDNLQAFQRESSSISYFGMPDAEYQERWVSRQQARLAILRSALEQLSWTVGETPATKHEVRIPEAEVDRKTVFLVHGRNDGAKETVARFLEKVGLKVTILHEQADAGKTIVEKFEHHSSVPFAVILATADDVGYTKGDATHPKPRARQNVILEMGYFLGKLGRKNVFVLVEDDIEIPSDYSGVLYTPFKPDGAWRSKLARELQVAGAEIDLSKAV